ncbi:hemerythrin [Spirochaetia bacterium]|nr:hemerythrin [Spirochaetia bacterium]
MSDEEVVEWDEKFSVKNSVIDKQHRELIKMTNELYAGCRRGGITERVTFMKTIQGAVNYAKVHFSVEEDLMRRANYPDYAAHKKEHEKFVAEVLREIKEFEKNQNFNTENFARFLLQWILNHIAVSDKQYIPFLQDRVFN